MLPTTLIARKELLDHLRDRRSLLSSALYALMGPIVVSLASFSLPSSSTTSPGANPLPALISVFTLVAAFSGGMSLAMDTVAGERERRSPEREMVREQAGQRLTHAVRRLPVPLRQVVTLALEGIDYAETAAILGISENNVGVRMSRARELLRKLLKERA